MLPVYEIIPGLKKLLTENKIVILQAPPGAGKSTVLPLELMREPWLNGKKILMLEPRRLAARAVASRLAEQLGESPGERVGYRVRFETVVGKNTQLEILTEGILTRMLQNDNSLDNVGLIIFDEFHERSLHADFALALCREVQDVLRDDLKILIMSATLDGQKLSLLLDESPVISCTGRQFPVELNYVEPDPSLSLAENTVKLILKSLKNSEGDVLTFLPGSGDIHRAAELLEKNSSGLSIHSLYGDLPFHLQKQALLPDPGGRRKVVLSTSIAETSLTIEGIKIVVDSGYARVPEFDPRTGLTKLKTVKVTLDTADQRAGRAGRTSPGICYRMWNEKIHHQLISNRQPEIVDADLSHLILETLNWGSSWKEIKWITPPPLPHIQQALTLLESLGAIENNLITTAGKKILEIPSHPRIALMLMKGKEKGISQLACDLAAIIEEKDPLPRSQSADVVLRMEALKKWRRKEYTEGERNTFERIHRVSEQWKKIIGKNDLPEADVNMAGELIAVAYPERIARRIDSKGRYRLANGRIAKLNDLDPLSDSEWIAIAQMDAGTNEGKIFLAADYDQSSLIAESKIFENISWDFREGVLIARKEWRKGNLVVKEEPLRVIDSQKIKKLLCEVVRQEGVQIFDWTNRAIQLKSRILSLKKWNPELEFPDFSDEALIANCENIFSEYLGNIKRVDDFKKLDLYSILHSSLSWESQNLLDKLTPEKIEVPTGSLITLEYSNKGNAPVLAVRLQELFGMSDTPVVNNGKVKVLLHLLSPAYRPVQITQDLRNFWNNTYHEVRKEMRIRYPKHSWPEDPWKAEPVRGAKKRRI